MTQILVGSGTYRQGSASTAPTSGTPSTIWSIRSTRWSAHPQVARRPVRDPAPSSTPGLCGTPWLPDARASVRSRLRRYHSHRAALTSAAPARIARLATAIAVPDTSRRPTRRDLRGVLGRGAHGRVEPSRERCPDDEPLERELHVIGRPRLKTALASDRLVCLCSPIPPAFPPQSPAAAIRRRWHQRGPHCAAVHRLRGRSIRRAHAGCGGAAAAGDAARSHACTPRPMEGRRRPAAGGRALRSGRNE
jgi:hypothetical protein